MMIKGYVFAGLLSFSVWHAAAQMPVSFIAEYIDFKIESNYFYVNGLYMFLNRMEKAVNSGILFPFALPSEMVDSIGVMNLTQHGRIVFRKRERDILFNVSMNPHDTVAVHIYYRQPLAAKNTYILTSTRSWGKPLEKAAYTLTTDKNLILRSFSLPPDSSVTDSVYKTYYWTKTDFDPPSDFEVTVDGP
jgi:hypothetical protein